MGKRREEASRVSHLQVGVVVVVGSVIRVGNCYWNWRDPAKHVEPFQDFVLTYKRNHKQRVQVKTLAKHPKVVGHQKIVE